MSRSFERVSSGFTLLEVLLSVTIMTIIVGISVPVYETFVRRNDMDLAAQNLVLTLRRAQSYARSVKSDAVWSVEVESGAVTLFQGTDFGSRDTAFDESFPLPPSVTPSGLTEVQFSKFNALPSTTGSITLTSSASGTRVITINAKGTVDY
jgi:prepilin-type N-terminal cleavage/methylation domain-containing protein